MSITFVRAIKNIEQSAARFVLGRAIWKRSHPIWSLYVSLDLEALTSPYLELMSLYRSGGAIVILSGVYMSLYRSGDAITPSPYHKIINMSCKSMLCPFVSLATCCPHIRPWHSFGFQKFALDVVELACTCGASSKPPEEVCQSV